VFRKEEALDFDAMDSFMTHVLDIVSTNGKIATRIFPPDSFALLSFADKVAVEVVSHPHLLIL
jgi:recyclin-1